MAFIGWCLLEGIFGDLPEGFSKFFDFYVYFQHFMIQWRTISISIWKSRTWTLEKMRHFASILTFPDLKVSDVIIVDGYFLIEFRYQELH